MQLSGPGPRGIFPWDFTPSRWLSMQGRLEVISSSRSDSTTAPTAQDTFASDPKGIARDARPGVVTLFPRLEDGAPDTWQVGQSLTVGRSRTAGVRLADARVSGVHAALEARSDGVFVRDMESRHGSFVNGALVPTAGATAEYGSVLRFGDTLLLVVDQVERYRSRPRRADGARLGLSQQMVAGPTLAQVWDEAARVAQLRDPVLILGESGSGKECLARLLHAARAQSGPSGPFVGINVAAIPESLFEAELFGHERGAFTGAAMARTGAFRDAGSGVLFLDEVGDLRADVQAKLLRAIDLRCVRPLGANRDVPVEARIVTATSRDLRAAGESGSFRLDLYYRLSGIVIRVPPLRERRDDIVLLALASLREQAPELRLSTDAAERLVLAQWEGNARHLRNVITHAVGRTLGSGRHELRALDLPDLAPFRDSSDALTVERIQAAMAQSGGIASHAARALGVSRTTLYTAFRRLNIDRGR